MLFTQKVAGEIPIIDGHIDDSARSNGFLLVLMVALVLPPV
jgi:hypothetical protein